MSLWLILLAVMFPGLTGLTRRYSLSIGLLDIPNERSSHTLPTPRGIGMVVEITLLLVFSLLSVSGFLSFSVFWVVPCAGFS